MRLNGEGGGGKRKMKKSRGKEAKLFPNLCRLNFFCTRVMGYTDKTKRTTNNQLISIHLLGS